MSNNRKRKKLKITRAEKAERKSSTDLQTGLREGTIIPVDRTKIFSHSVLPTIPDYFRDRPFKCKDCDKDDLWTAKEQKRWYEELGGEIESVAIRCRPCRQKEKLRKEQARREHLDGLKKQNPKT